MPLAAPRTTPSSRVRAGASGSRRTAAEVARAPPSIPAEDAQWWHVSLFDTAVVTDPSQRGCGSAGGTDEMLELARRGGAVLWRLVREGGGRARYRAGCPS